MELEKLVMAELENMDLNGAKIINLSWEAETININFEIGDVQIDFTAQNEADFQITVLKHGDQVYTDEATLSQCNDWTKYVLAVIHPIIKKHQAELKKVVDEIKFDEPKEDESAAIAPLEKSDLSNRIKEAEARGHKEGFKAARRMNIQEIKKLKKKYNNILVFIIIILLSAFFLYLYLYGFDEANRPAFFPQVGLEYNTNVNTF